MNPQGLKDPEADRKATEAAREAVPEAQPGRIPDPYLPEVGPDHPDAKLVDLWRQRTNLLWPLRLDEIDFATEVESDAYLARLPEIDRRISATPAATIVGVAIKARLSWQFGHPARVPTPWVPIEAAGDPDGSDEYALYSLVSNAVRLAMAYGKADAELFKLCEEWRQAFGEAESLEVRADPLPEGHAAHRTAAEVHDRCRSVERQILATKAQTAEGVIAKLRLVAAIWGDEPQDPEHFDATDGKLMCSAANDAGALPEGYPREPS